MTTPPEFLQEPGLLAPVSCLVAVDADDRASSLPGSRRGSRSTRGSASSGSSRSRSRRGLPGRLRLPIELFQRQGQQRARSERQVDLAARGDEQLLRRTRSHRRSPPPSPDRDGRSAIARTNHRPPPGAGGSARDARRPRRGRSDLARRRLRRAAWLPRTIPGPPRWGRNRTAPCPGASAAALAGRAAPRDRSPR